MKHENDFVWDEEVDLKIKGYEKGDFKYKPTDAGQENEWLDEYMDDDGNQSKSELNKCKLRNLTKVPYTKELIKKVTGVQKDWKQLNKDQRWKVLKKLKPTVFSKIAVAISKVDMGEIKKKDN